MVLIIALKIELNEYYGRKIMSSPTNTIEATLDLIAPKRTEQESTTHGMSALPFNVFLNDYELESEAGSKPKPESEASSSTDFLNDPVSLPQPSVSPFIGSISAGASNSNGAATAPSFPSLSSSADALQQALFSTSESVHAPSPSAAAKDPNIRIEDLQSFTAATPSNFIPSSFDELSAMMRTSSSAGLVGSGTAFVPTVPTVATIANNLSAASVVTASGSASSSSSAASIDPSANVSFASTFTAPTNNGPRPLDLQSTAFPTFSLEAWRKRIEEANLLDLLQLEDTLRNEGALINPQGQNWIAKLLVDHQTATEIMAKKIHEKANASNTALDNPSESKSKRLKGMEENPASAASSSTNTNLESSASASASSVQTLSPPHTKPIGPGLIFSNLSPSPAMAAASSSSSAAVVAQPKASIATSAAIAQPSAAIDGSITAAVVVPSNGQSIRKSKRKRK